jgi:GT2 family glycosyltransferase
VAVHRTISANLVCAVVVNWNGWRDTIVCLESLLELRGMPMRVIVCDNASSDQSMAELEQYMRTRLAGWHPAEGELGFQHPQPADGVVSAHLLRLSLNLGYAGALNAGIEWARQRWTPRGFWLLNNDVKALAGALGALVSAQERVPAAGICGSVLLEWDEPDCIQAVAGVYRRWLGVGWHDKNIPAGTDVSFAVDYPVGASMYVGADYLDKVGPMDPAYFLYCEEMDWVERGRRHGYRPVIALNSRLRHKEGASTGSRGGVRNKSLLSEHYGVVSRLRITRKFWPHYLPVVWCSLLLVIVDRLLHGETTRAGVVLRLMFSPSQWLRDRLPAADVRKQNPQSGDAEHGRSEHEIAQAQTDVIHEHFGESL